MSFGRDVHALRSKVTKLDRMLAEVYGDKGLCGGDDPVDTLVETILSQNTTDKNSHRAFLALKKEYPEWRDLLGEDPATVSRVIRSGGLSDIKAARILAALGFINEERGRIELDFLRSMSPAQADTWLARIKGVGPKTRSIVLLFSLGLPSFPVDTHVHRVTSRLGLIGPRVSREKAQEELADLVPEDRYFSFHINLIEHGRAVCKARNPLCDECPLSGSCGHFAATT